MGYKFLSWIGLVPALPWVTCQQASFPLDQLSVCMGVREAAWKRRLSSMCDMLDSVTSQNTKLSSFEL